MPYRIEIKNKNKNKIKYDIISDITYEEDYMFGEVVWNVKKVNCFKLKGDE